MTALKRTSALPVDVFLALTITTFCFCLSQSHDGAFLQKSLPAFLLILASTLQMLSGLKQMDSDITSGRLAFFLSNTTTVQGYVVQKLWERIICESLPISLLLGSLLFFIDYAFLKTVGVFFLVSINIQSLCLVLSSIRIQQKISGVFSIFLLWPLIIPQILLALVLLDSTSSPTTLFIVDIVFLMIGLSCAMIGSALLLTPRLLRLSFEG